ncbi:MAG: hypothetical protein ACRDMV_19025 [Streptosporangiales bacterium]
MRRIGVGLAGLALVAVAAGCGSGSDGGGESLPSQTASPTPSKLDVSGIVVLDTQTGDPDDVSGDAAWRLRVFDPDTGKNTMNLAIPLAAADHDPNGFSARPEPWTAARGSFSSDWQYFAYNWNGSIYILKLDAASRSYTPKATVKADTGSYSGGEVSYDQPRFSRAGHRLWFSASPEQGSTKLESVDYTAPGKPREEATLKRSRGNLDTRWRLTAGGKVTQYVQTPKGGDFGTWTLYGPDGKAAEKARTQNGNKVSYVMADGKVAGGALETDENRYRLIDTIGDHTMLVHIVGLGGFANQDEQLLSVHVDPGSGRAKVQTVAKAGAEKLLGAALAPDHERAVLLTRGGFYIKKLGTSSEPQPFRKSAGDERDAYGPYVLGWTK